MKLFGFCALVGLGLLTTACGASPTAPTPTAFGQDACPAATTNGVGCPAPTVIIVHGKIFDGLEGRHGLAGATVRVTGCHQATTLSDTDGRYRLTIPISPQVGTPNSGCWLRVHATKTGYVGDDYGNFLENFSGGGFEDNPSQGSYMRDLQLFNTEYSDAS